MTVRPASNSNARNTPDSGFPQHPFGVNFRISDILVAAWTSCRLFASAVLVHGVVVHGVVVPGGVGTGGGADCGAPPWYGSGVSPHCTDSPLYCHCGPTALIPHCTATVDHCTGYWDTTGPLYRLLGHYWPTVPATVVPCTGHCGPGGG